MPFLDATLYKYIWKLWNLTVNFKIEMKKKKDDAHIK